MTAFVETNPGPVKYAASRLGLCSPEMRLPMVPLTDGAKQVVDAAMAKAGLVTAAAGLTAWAIAAGGAGIYELIEWTSALGTSGVLVAFLFGAWSRIGAGAAAVGAILAGFASNAVTMVWPVLRGGEPMDGAFLLSIAVSLAAYLVLSAVPALRLRPGASADISSAGPV